METTSRTLVKSPPEVWEHLDHPGRMQGLMSALVGRAAEVTNVSVSAENGDQATKLEGWLDAVLDELATPQKRPFGGMGEAREPEAPKPEIAVVEETPAEDEPEESAEPEVEEPAAETPAPGPPAAKPRKQRRRFFRF